MSSSYVTFLKTDEEFGGLSNMSGAFPIAINGVRVSSSEHLYQMLKFPDHPEIQSEILSKASPISCKMVARKKVYQEFIRPDWKEIQLEVMEFCLRTKLLWHWMKFGNLLRSTEGKVIYEISSRNDKYWAVVALDNGFLGENHLGKLLMKLRDELLSDNNEPLRAVTPPQHLDLRFLGKPIKTRDRRDHLRQVGTRTSEMVNALRP